MAVRLFNVFIYVFILPILPFYSSNEENFPRIIPIDIRTPGSYTRRRIFLPRFVTEVLLSGFLLFKQFDNMKIQHEKLDNETEKLFNEYFHAKDSMINVKRGTIVAKKYLDISEDILNMDVRPDDTWLISYVRTGSTWTQEMIWCISNDLNFEGAKVPGQVRFPVLELTSLLALDPLNWKDQFANSVDAVKQMKSPRYIKTHLPWELLPYQIQSGVVKPKIIYITRDPKDVAVSYYHFFKLLNGFHGSCEDFCKFFSDGKVPLGSIWDHVPPFWSRRNEPNVLFLKYEEMKQDIVKMAQNCAQFLGKTITDMDALLDYLSLNNMRKNHAINLEDLKIGHERMSGKSDPENHFIRTGNVGEWKKFLNKKLAEIFDEKSRKYFDEIGLFFDKTHNID